ncbi:hypothetical protein MUP05_06570 [Candidatus Bathyarchaeota archaeon]|nr:hypothetical protein [Candidatus Bathyarchaeota archaeon]
MSESDNPLGLCPQCLEKLRPVLHEIRDRLKHVDEDLLKLRGGAAEW